MIVNTPVEFFKAVPAGLDYATSEQY